MIETNFNYSWALTVDTVRSYAYINNMFTSEECDAIIELCKSNFKMRAGEVLNGSQVTPVESYRDSNIAFCPPTADLIWVYQRITDGVNQLNRDYFNFDLWGFSEGLQFTEYVAPAGKYDAHIDKMNMGVIRKLSIVVQLSDENSYEGGDFEIIEGKDPEKLSKNKGTLLAFPSYVLHRVTPVTKGTRHSMVGWITGKPFV
jgi:PKHD-type hydroxylase